MDLNAIQFKHSQVDVGDRRPRHRIEAFDDGSPVGRLEWHGTTHRITRLDVEQSHARRGIATEMWNRSQEVRPRAQHSGDRTAMGDAWAKTVSGKKPRRVRY